MKKHILILISLTFINLTVFSQVNLQNGLVAYYPFNGNANDESGNGNHGILSSPPPTAINDRYNNANKALDFNNLQNITIPHSTTIDLVNTEASFVAWIKPGNADSDVTYQIFSKSSGFDQSQRKFGVYLRGTTDKTGYYLSFELRTINTTDDANPTPAFVPNNKWTFIAVIYKQNKKYYYIDGVLKDTRYQSISSTDENIISNTNDAKIGLFAVDNWSPFNGAIDDIRIYNRAINVDEVQALYNEGTVDLQNGLIAYYPFNENANDESGNGNHGTLTGGSFERDKWGNTNSSIRLNGYSLNNDFITLTPNIYSGTDFTISTNIKINTYGKFSRIFDFGTPWNLSITPSTPAIRGRTGDYTGELFFEIMNSNTTFVGEAFKSTGVLNLGTWYNIAYVGSNNNIKIYLDGTLILNTTFPGVPTPGSSNYTHNYINKANRTDLIDQAMDVNFDEYRIYNRALNQAEISQLVCKLPISPMITLSNNKLMINSLLGPNLSWYKYNTSLSGANNNVLQLALQKGTYKVKLQSGACETFSHPFYIGINPGQTTISNVITITNYRLVIKDIFGNTISGNNLRKEANEINLVKIGEPYIFFIQSEQFDLSKVMVWTEEKIKVGEFLPSKIDLNNLKPGKYILKVLDRKSTLIKEYAIAVILTDG